MAPEQSTCSVVIYTLHHRIEGQIVLLKGERLSDKLNVTDRRFEPVEEARVYTVDRGQLIHEAPYLAVNKDHVTTILPQE